MDKERYDKGMKIRREVLGDADDGALCRQVPRDSFAQPPPGA